MPTRFMDELVIALCSRSTVTSWVIEENAGNGNCKRD